MIPQVHVAVAVLVDASGHILVSRRPPDSEMGGRWEFPGGKVDPGEAAVDALVRELDEELGVEPRGARPLIRFSHEYPDIRVLLDVWRVPAWEGRLTPRAADELMWVEPEKLLALDLLDADRPIVNAIRIPVRYGITGAKGHLMGIERLIDAGHKMIQLRAPDFDATAFRNVASDAVSLSHLRDTKLLLNADVELVRALDADGVHLSSVQLRAIGQRPLPLDKLVGASCHNAEELSHARAIGCDFAVLGPVDATASHGNADALGWERFAMLAEGAGMPVYALGGLGDSDIETAWHHHGQGVAGISAWWPHELTLLP